MFLQTKNIIFFVKQPALKFDDRTFRAPCADPRQPIPNINFPVFLSQSLIKGYYLLGSRTSSTSRPVFFEREARTSKVLFLCFFANLSTPPLSFSPFLFLPLISSLPFFPLLLYCPVATSDSLCLSLFCTFNLPGRFEFPRYGPAPSPFSLFSLPFSPCRSVSLALSPSQFHPNPPPFLISRSLFLLILVFAFSSATLALCTRQPSPPLIQQPPPSLGHRR